MSDFKFNFRNLREFKYKMDEMGISIPLSKNVDILSEPIEEKIVNRLVIQPMEGYDSTVDGKPGKLTIRRYRRFAESGVGVLWFEGTAATQMGRSNPRQLLICKENAEAFKKLVKEIKDIYKSSFGDEPYLVLQLMHAGRYSNPTNNNKSIFVHENPYLNDKLKSISHIVSDEELNELEDKFVEVTKIAKEAGFNAVDIKSCHGYLISELLSAFTREGKYGGSFESRTRFLLNVIDRIKHQLGDSIDLAVRINMYDGIPYPYGWGVDRKNYLKYDLAEPLKLIKILCEKGVKIINVTAGDPHYNSHITRPFDVGSYKSPEHPLLGVYRLLNLAREAQKVVPEVLVIASGLSWLREYAVNVAAGCIEDGWFSLAGFGRQAFAYPNFAKNIFNEKSMTRENCCITCSKCSEMMRSGGVAGCVIRDSEVYAPIYREKVTSVVKS